MRMLWRCVIPLVLGAVASSGCREPLNTDECNQLLDHYVELLVRAREAKTPIEDIFKMQSEARRKAALDPEFARCSTQVSRSQFDCAMKALTADAVEQCLL
jgi:hypothetical protein